MKILKTFLLLTLVYCRPEQIRHSGFSPLEGWFCTHRVNGETLDRCPGTSMQNLLVVHYAFSIHSDSENKDRCHDEARAFVSLLSNQQSNQFISDFYPLPSETCTALNPRAAHSFADLQVENCVEYVNPSDTFCKCAISTTYKGGQIQFEKDLLDKTAPFNIIHC